MADVKRLSPDRWAALVAHFSRLRREPLEKPEDLVEIKITQPIEADGVTFLPALYRKT